MQIVESSTVTYIYLNGLVVPCSIPLSDSIELQPACTSHLDLQTTLSICSHPNDFAVAAGFMPRITAELKICAPSPEEAATVAWNASWDMLLLSAILRCEIGFNLQSDTSASALSADSWLSATNLYMRGLTHSAPYEVTSEDLHWIRNNYGTARGLLAVDQFRTAVHCLASYRWHSMPRVQLAILWAGIEGMFGASAEIRFRLSLYIARFLHPDDEVRRRDTFAAMKRLYDSRSAAVHGSKIKGNAASVVNESADVLCSLLRRCTDRKSMPVESDLVP